MKTIVYWLLLVSCSPLLAQTTPGVSTSGLAGEYVWIVPGSRWTLKLSEDGLYAISVTGCADRDRKSLESGRWEIDALQVRLHPNGLLPDGREESYRELSVLRHKSGHIALVSDLLSFGQPGKLPFRYCFIRDGDSLWLNDDNQNERKEAEPGATDNPGDAQRIREDH